MPRQEIDYSKCLIYKLCCNNPTITDIYIGHTTDKIRRKQGHKNTYNNPNSKKYNYYVYEFIRNNGGWNNWSMIVVEEYPCENKNQAELRERHWIETESATLNTYIPTRTHKEYCEENKEKYKKLKKMHSEKYKEEYKERHKLYYEERKEKIKEQRQTYYEEHKEEINEKNRRKCECKCGEEYSYGNRNRHMKSIKHLKYLEQDNQIST